MPPANENIAVIAHQVVDLERQQDEFQKALQKMQSDFAQEIKDIRKEQSETEKKYLRSGISVLGAAAIALVGWFLNALHFGQLK
jgi:hypothetical protein